MDKSTMRAYKLVNWGQPGEFVTVPKPTVGPNDVLLRVKAVGLCRSDLDMMDSQPGSDPYASAIDAGYILGHETTGVVEELGELITDLTKGEAVAVHHMRHCGFCEFCAAGIEQHCDTFRRGAIGMTRGCGIDGGLAEYLALPRSEVISLGRVDPVLYAPLTDAGVTAYAGCKDMFQHVRPGAFAVVIGIGGLGAYAVQFLRTLTAGRIIAVDNSPERLELAKSLGVTATVISDSNAKAEIHRITSGKLASGVIDLVGSDTTLRLAADVIRPRGIISVVGMQGGSVQLGWNLIATGARFALSLGSTRQDLEEVCQLATDGRLRIDIDRFSFDQIPEAYSRLREGRLTGRAVIVMD